MLRSMQNEAGRQLVRKLTDEPMDLRDAAPTDGELAEGRRRAMMLHGSAAPVGAAAGAIGVTVALVKIVGGRMALGGVVGALFPPAAAVAGVGLALWGLHRWVEGS